MKHTSEKAKRKWCIALFILCMITGIGWSEETMATTILEFEQSYANVGDTITLKDADTSVNYQWSITNQISGGTKTVNSASEYTVQEEDLESLITVSAEGYESAMIYISKIPVVYISSDTDYYGVLLGDYSECNMTFGGSSEYDNDKVPIYSGEAGIKLRGNSTNDRPKRPFKVKLKDKADLYGMGESKHWVLLANDIDHTHMRNKLLMDFSRDIGTETYMDSMFVSLIYNGEYMGIYQLAEHIRISDERVDIYDWENQAEDIADTITATDAKDETFCDGLEDALVEDFTWIDSGQIMYDGITYQLSDYGIEIPEATGGFILEMDFYSKDDNSLARLETAYKQPIYFNAPSLEGGDVSAFANTSLFQYADRYVQTFEYALHSDDFVFRNADKRFERFRSKGPYSEADYTDEQSEGMHYSEMFDMDSLVQNFIFCEFAMNWDSMKNSFFLYKDLDGLAKIGPQWDFDWCWGNVNMYGINTWYPESWHTTEDDFTREQYYQTVQWNRMLIRDPYFLMKAYEKYQEIRPTVIENMLKQDGLIEQYVELLKEAASANDAKWSYTYKDRRYYESGNSEEFSDAVASMREFIDTRIAWMDKQMESYETFVDSLGYYKVSNRISVKEVDTESESGFTKITAEVAQSSIAYVIFQVNGTYMQAAAVEDGTATVKIPDFALSQVDGAGNIVEVKAAEKDGSYCVDLSSSETSVYNLVHSNYAIFNKSGLEIDEQAKAEYEANKANPLISEELKASSVNTKKNNSSSNDNSSNNADNSNGDNSIVLVVVIILLVAMIVVAVVVRGKKKMKKCKL